MPDSPLSQAALVTSALPLLGIGYNVFQGDTDVSISPMLGVNVDPATGSFMPSIAANVQVKRINGLFQDLFSRAFQFGFSRYLMFPGEKSYSGRF